MSPTSARRLTVAATIACAGAAVVTGLARSRRRRAGGRVEAPSPRPIGQATIPLDPVDQASWESFPASDAPGWRR